MVCRDYQIVDVELNLATDKKLQCNWENVRLLFVRGQCEFEPPQVGKKDWAVFGTKDTTMEAAKILKIYAMRWGIEVYFKEAKQHLGFLIDPTETAANHIASIHLTAIRYLMLVQAKLEYADSRVCDVRNYLNKQLETVDEAQTFMGGVKNYYQWCFRRCTGTNRFGSGYCYVCY